MSSMFALWAATLLGTGGPVTALSVVPAAERTQVLQDLPGRRPITDTRVEPDGPERGEQVLAAPCPVVVHE